MESLSHYRVAVPAGRLKVGPENKGRLLFSLSLSGVVWSQLGERERKKRANEVERRLKAEALICRAVSNSHTHTHIHTPNFHYSFVAHLRRRDLNSRLFFIIQARCYSASRVNEIICFCFRMLHLVSLYFFFFF